MPRLEDIILRDTRANQPLATAVASGTLYFVIVENVLERSNGTIWESYSGSGSGSNNFNSNIAGLLTTLEGERGEDSYIPGMPGPIGATGAAGSGGDVIPLKTVIPHASILTLSSIPVEVVPAPGVGKFANLVKMTTIKETTAGVYSANPNISLRYNGVATDIITATAIQLLSNDKRSHRFADPGAQIFTPPSLNTSIVFRSAADVTGGNAANYIVVQILYTIITDGP